MGIAAAGAQDAPATPAPILSGIVELNSLNTVQTKPWHLKATYARFDTAAPEIDGTLEMWWTGKDQARLEVTEADKKSVYLLTPQGRLRSNDSAHLSQAMEALVGAIEQPFPPNLFDLLAEPQAQSFGDLATRCYARPTRQTTDDAPKTVSLPAFCVDDANVVRVAWLHGPKVTRDDIRSFDGHEVPGKVTVSFGDRVMARGQVDELSEAPDANVSMATDGFVPDVFTGPVRVSGGVMAGMMLTRIAPIYPIEAKQKHITGTVIFAARIGKDGKISDLRVVSPADKLLTEAAEDAVRQWRYRPYELNGVPTEVNTTITVNFHLN